VGMAELQTVVRSGGAWGKLARPRGGERIQTKGQIWQGYGNARESGRARDDGAQMPPRGKQRRLGSAWEIPRGEKGPKDEDSTPKNNDEMRELPAAEAQ